MTNDNSKRVNTSAGKRVEFVQWGGKTTLTAIGNLIENVGKIVAADPGSLNAIRALAALKKAQAEMVTAMDSINRLEPGRKPRRFQ